MKIREQRDSAWRTFGRWLTNKDWSPVLAAESCKEKLDIFITDLQNAVDTYLPWKTLKVHPTDRPWTTKKIKKLIKERQAVFTWERKDSPLYKLLRNKVEREIRSASFHCYYHKVSDIQHTDLKRWWKQIKSLIGQDIHQEWFHQFLRDDCPVILSLWLIE